MIENERRRLRDLGIAIYIRVSDTTSPLNQMDYLEGLTWSITWEAWDTRKTETPTVSNQHIFLGSIRNSDCLLHIKNGRREWYIPIEAHYTQSRIAPESQRYFAHPALPLRHLLLTIYSTCLSFLNGSRLYSSLPQFMISYDPPGVIRLP